MSELIIKQTARRDFRWNLLTTVSALALLTSMSVRDAKAADEHADRPTAWIELGGQLEQMSGGQETFVPPFVANIPGTFFSPLSVQKHLQFSNGAQGSLLLHPASSDWVFSASVLYGRSNGTKQKHQQTPNARLAYNHIHIIGSLYKTGTKYPSGHVNFEDAKAQESEAHAVVDFQAGKDVGLGLFSNHGSSVFSAGIRFAQFTSKSNISLRAEPDVRYPSAPITNKYELVAFNNAVIPPFHDYAGLETSQRSFRGVGPSLAWKASAPFAGNSDSGEVTLDWGANAAILFGRQKARGHHQTTVKTYHKSRFSTGFQTLSVAQFMNVAVTQHNNAAPFNRARTVVVPNFGGFGGISFRYTNAKVSFGYRADFFLGAMDGGIDTPKSYDRNFFGPYASVSIGLGG